MSSLAASHQPPVLHGSTLAQPAAQALGSSCKGSISEGAVEGGLTLCLCQHASPSPIPGCMPPLQRLRQDNRHKVKASLGYTE